MSFFLSLRSTLELLDSERRCEGRETDDCDRDLISDELLRNDRLLLLDMLESELYLRLSLDLSRFFLSRLSDFLCFLEPFPRLTESLSESSRLRDLCFPSFLSLLLSLFLSLLLLRRLSLRLCFLSWERSRLCLDTSLSFSGILYL